MAKESVMVGRFIVVTMWAVCMVASVLIAALAIFIAVESVGAYNALMFLVAFMSPLMMWAIGTAGEKEGYRSYLQSFISFFTGWEQAIRELKARGWLHYGSELRSEPRLDYSCIECDKPVSHPNAVCSQACYAKHCGIEEWEKCGHCLEMWPSKEMYTSNTCMKCAHTVGEDHPSY
jgi:hypothetical protein